VQSAAASAFATGYASAAHPDIWPPSPLARNHRRAAIAASSTDTLLLVAEAGQKAAYTTALHRSRLRLYDQHETAIMVAAAPFLAHVDAKELAVLLALLAQHPRTSRQAQAITTITNAVHGITGSPVTWDDANSAAFQAAVARGMAEADASPTHGPANPADVKASHAAAAKLAATIRGGGPEWTRRQISRVAWQLSAENVLTATTPHVAVAGILHAHAGVGAAAGDLMHKAWGQAFVAGVVAGAAIANMPTPMFNFQTQEDDLVCPDCDDAEENGPYAAGDLPPCPLHPSCRCSTEAA
jgi:hypothetical protein